jgi:hypothetical protein
MKISIKRFYKPEAKALDPKEAWDGVKTATRNQCCGSGSSCFWASCIRIQLRIFLYDFLSLKNNVNLASKSNKQKNNYFLVAILKVTDENSRNRSRIRIRESEVRIRRFGAGYGSVPKSHGSTTLPEISYWSNFKVGLFRKEITFFEILIRG